VAVALQLGTDIGGAIPFPLRHVPGTYNPYPRLNLSLGGRAAMQLHAAWSVAAGVTYKTVSLDADARVTDQRFQDGEALQYFTGSAGMSARFTFLEVPLHACYHLPGGHARVLFGLYGAWTIEGIFRVEPRKGFIGPSAGTFAAAVDPGMEEMRFDAALDSWDAGLLAGYERQLLPRVDIGLRVSCGFKDIFKRGNRYFDYSMIHARGSVVVSYDIVGRSTRR
jgi:hypothetical protein